MSGHEYQIGYALERSLRRMASTRPERDAIDRLAEFRGTERDVRMLAKLAGAEGSPMIADQLLALLEDDE